MNISFPIPFLHFDRLQFTTGHPPPPCTSSTHHHHQTPSIHHNQTRAPINPPLPNNTTRNIQPSRSNKIRRLGEEDEGERWSLGPHGGCKSLRSVVMVAATGFMLVASNPLGLPSWATVRLPFYTIPQPLPTPPTSSFSPSLFPLPKTPNASLSQSSYLTPTVRLPPPSPI